MRHPYKIALLVFAAVVAIAISPRTGKADDQPSPEWFTCNTDKECVDVSFACAGAVVNQAFADKAKKYYGDINARTNCVSPDASTDTPPYKIFCENHTCKSQGINPHPGFS